LTLSIIYEGIPLVDFTYPTWIGLLISLGVALFIALLSFLIVKPIVKRWMERDEATFGRYSTIQRIQHLMCCFMSYRYPMPVNSEPFESLQEPLLKNEEENQVEPVSFKDKLKRKIRNLILCNQLNNVEEKEKKEDEEIEKKETEKKEKTSLKMHVVME